LHELVAEVDNINCYEVLAETTPVENFSYTDLLIDLLVGV